MEQESHFKILKTLEINPDATQRELASDLGMSLGKVNYCLKRLVEKGWVEVNNFRSSPNKRAYAYMLTPKGIERKVQLAREFLRWKMAEYDRLRQEIDELETELPPDLVTKNTEQTEAD